LLGLDLFGQQFLAAPAAMPSAAQRLGRDALQVDLDDVDQFEQLARTSSLWRSRRRART
jgi:hypothetical protein